MPLERQRALARGEPAGITVVRADLRAVGLIDSAAINALTGAHGDIRVVLDVTVSSLRSPRTDRARLISCNHPGPAPNRSTLG